MRSAFKIFSVILAFLAFSVLFTFSVSAKNTAVIKIEHADKAKAIYLYNYNSKTVLYSKGEDIIIQPASTVKIMTGLISCERLSKRLNETVVISDDMLAGHNGTSMGLKVGMNFKIKDLLYGAICGGNNDAAQALAVLCSGSVEAFVNDMNRYANELDMYSTVYKNPTGLDENGAQTTIADVAILSKKAAKNALYMQISSAKNYIYKDFNQNDAVIYNRNALISHFTATQYLNEYASGLIAGSTDKGGYVVATVAESLGTSYLCIVMGAQSEQGEIYSYKIANELILKAFSKYSSRKVLQKGEVISNSSVNYALSAKKEIKISCVVENDIFAYLPTDVDIKKDLEYRAYFHEQQLNAPIDKGTVVGGLNVYLNGNLVGSSRIVADDTVEENSFLIFMEEMKSFFLSRYFLIFVIIAIPSIVVFLYFERMGKRCKRSERAQYKKFF